MRLFNIDRLRDDGYICLFSQLTVIYSAYGYWQAGWFAESPQFEYYLYAADNTRDRNLTESRHVYQLAAAPRSDVTAIPRQLSIKLLDLQLALFAFGGAEAE